MRIFLFLLFVLFISVHASAQFETNYTPIVSKGNLPKDFVTLSATKYETEKSRLSKSEKRETRKTKEKFLLQSNFSIDEMLLSGRVIFNDPMATYVNKVADNVLASEPQLRNELRFYILKTTAVNAFATNQGVVFVTTGLLAQLENEAQLAFIISHEVIHYKEQHAIEKFIEEDNIERGKGAYKKMNVNDQFLTKCAFSKENEKESDEHGLKIFLKSKYSTAHLLGIYDVLKYSYLPFDDIEFDKAFLENSTLKIPADYYKTQTLAIDVNDIEDDDTRSTHPSIISRRAKTAEGIANADNTGKSDYLVGEAEFKHIRETARFELCRLYTLRRRYESGIYTSYMLLKKYPNNLYLKKNVAYCLEGLAQYSATSAFRDVHYNSDSIEGKAQALFYLMFRLDSVKGDMGIVALAYIAGLRKDYPADADIDELYKSALRLVASKDGKELEYFTNPQLVSIEGLGVTLANQNAINAMNNLPDAEKLKTDTLKTAVNEGVEKSKYEKLREQIKVETKAAEATPHFTKFAFIDLMKEDWFKKDYEAAAKEKKSEKVEVDLDEGSTYTRKHNWDRRIYALGIKRLVVVDPYYARIDARKKEKYKYLESEGGQVDFTERIRLSAKAAKMDVEVLNSKNLEETETAKINEIAIMEDYISERLSHEKDIDLPYAERQRVKEIAAKYGTDYFMWTGTISLSDRNMMNTFLIMYSVLFPPLLPFTLPAMINNGHYTLYFAVLYDIKSDEIKLATFRQINNRTRGYLLNSHIYDVFNQVKSNPKKS